jgi:hypothetical protein
MELEPVDWNILPNVVRERYSEQVIESNKEESWDKCTPYFQHKFIIRVWQHHQIEATETLNFILSNKI